MNTATDDRTALEILERRICALLPEVYQDTYDEVKPTSMGSAGLKFNRKGEVAWDQMWSRFCDLAMAGGPPHKGTLLEPATPSEIDAEPGRHQIVIAEIIRGIGMVSGLRAHPSPVAGWVRVRCDEEGMAAWLLRAIVVENVAARVEGRLLDLPAAPHFRLEKEIKNVVTVIAKTCHYWMDHTSAVRQVAIGQLLEDISAETPLIEPLTPSDRRLTAEDQTRFTGLAETLRRETGLPRSSHEYAGWIGVECPSVGAAIWMMRALVVGNVLSRREDKVLFVPFNPAHDPHGDRVVGALVRTRRLAAQKGLL